MKQALVFTLILMCSNTYAQELKSVPNEAYGTPDSESAMVIYTLANVKEQSWGPAQKLVSYSAKVLENEDQTNRITCIKTTRLNENSTVAPQVSFKCNTARSLFGQRLRDLLKPL